MLSRKAWEREIQHFEAEWWGDCANTYGEETKQIAYAKVMGLPFDHTWRGGDHWPRYDFAGEAVLDVGGGPSSMLLKSTFETGVVVDPCPYPDWVAQRYRAHGVEYRRTAAEDDLAAFGDREFDVALIYNVLQHVMDPAKILSEMARVAARVYLFEWIGTPPHPGHPHTLQAEGLSMLLPSGAARHVWFDEQYNEIGPESPSPVRQHGWGGGFGG